jgi:DNA mismatch repair protein MutL
MKKAASEASSVQDVMNQFILSRPDVSFRYISDGRILLHSPGDGQLASSVLTVFGSKSMSFMRKVEGHASGILLKGFVGISEIARGNRSQEYFFINKRMMHSAVLSNALETACRERVMIGRFPVCALHLQIAYDAVDVNVHPNKLEVRFRDEKAVSEAVLSLVLESLKEPDAFEHPVEMKLTHEPASIVAPVPTQEKIRQSLAQPSPNVSKISTIPPVSIDRTEVSSLPPLPMREQEQTTPFIRPVTSVSNSDDKEKADSLSRMIQEKTEQINTILPELPKQMKIFGALFNTFILVEYDNCLMMVDQHAVHERLLFDSLMKEHSAQNTGQELLVPVIINVSAKDIMLIEENRELFESIGLIIARFGEYDIAVRTVPVILGEAQTADFVREALSELEKNHTVTFDQKRADILQTACKHAIKGGETLTEDQLRTILNEMIEKHVTPTCPHGRPLVISITHREIDKKFKRIQD